MGGWSGLWEVPSSSPNVAKKKEKCSTIKNNNSNDNNNNNNNNNNNDDEDGDKTAREPLNQKSLM